jgi:quinol monooxygenase YgiN
MVIIAGKMYVAPEDRDKFVESHRDVIQAARKADGCIDVAVSADLIEPNRVNMFELWESDEQLKAWQAVATGPTLRVPILDGDVRKHQVSSSGPPFD